MLEPNYIKKMYILLIVEMCFVKSDAYTSPVNNDYVNSATLLRNVYGSGAEVPARHVRNSRADL